jgi:hypothetical protein
MFLYPAGPIIARFMASLKEFPPSQTGGSFVSMTVQENAGPDVLAAAAAEEQRLRDLNNKGLKSLQDDYDAVAAYNYLISD